MGGRTAPRMFRAFRHRDFRLLWAGMLAVNALLPLQFITAGLYLLDRGGESAGIALTGLLAAARGAGMLLFAVFGGVFADRMDRRRLLIVAQSLALAANAATALLMLFGGGSTVALALIFGCAFLSAGALAVDSPTRQAMIPQIVGDEDMANAIALDAVAIQFAFPLSLPLTGILIDTLGYGAAYAVSLLGHIAVLAALLSLRFRGEPAGGGGTLLGDLRAGIAYARGRRTVWWTIVLYFSLSSIAMPGVAQLGPVWMRTVLGLTPSQFGFMAATWGIGAMIASISLAHVGHFERKGALFVAAVLLFDVLVLGFGYSRSVPLTAAVNLGLGLTLSLCTISAVSLTQRLVPNAMQGRVMSLFMINQGLSQFAAAPVGGLGQWLGLPLVVPALGWVGLACAAAIVLAHPYLRAAGRLSPEAGPAGIVVP